MDTTCIDMSISGTGTPSNPFIISANPIICPVNNGIQCAAPSSPGCAAGGLQVVPSTDAGNTMTFGTDGRLFTPTVDPVCISTLTNCLALDGSGCVNLLISADACNGLECHPDGLFVFDDPMLLPPAVGNAANFGPSGTLSGTFTDMVIEGPFCVTLNNPSACRDIISIAQAGGNLNIQKSSGDLFVAIQVSNNGGATWNSVVQTGFADPGPSAMHWRGGGTWLGDSFNIASGGSRQLCFRIVASGNTLTGGIIEFSDRGFVLIPTGWAR